MKTPYGEDCIVPNEEIAKIIMNALPSGISIISGSVGPKGAFGYYLSD